LSFFFDLLLLSWDFPLDLLDFPSSLDLSVLFFDAAVSEPFFLDLLLLSDFVEVDCFVSEPFFLDLLLLIKAEAGIQVVGAKVGDKVTTSSKLLLLLLTDLLDFLEDLLAFVDLDLDSLDFLARRRCDAASDDSTEAARRPWRTGRLVVKVVDAEVKVVVAARRTTRCFVEKYMILLLF
jgi:hypothetical protein